MVRKKGHRKVEILMRGPFDFFVFLGLCSVSFHIINPRPFSVILRW